MPGPRKRSVTIRGHRTSFSLEAPFHDELERLARLRGLTAAALIAEIDAARPRDTNLSSALRVYVLEALKQEASRQS
ncbi:ribbon-helix-helix domain-containing protein [Chelativorans intermedius]|uniref:Ribbon-helix-helix domain-containing protein n=1 Tax=Chelativorans intermedius TaxID=515947 RepID=A0ABV6D3K3_9HYPH|nr:ribbon-helix-helix domain-containing protein [Chelativorans intermedius]MCT8996902.1 ribbon-helix-helix domain-containing protein [Chelativorans intermedius]